MRGFNYLIVFFLFSFVLKSQSVDSVLNELRLIKDNRKKIHIIYQTASKKGIKKDVFNQLDLILDTLQYTLTDEEEIADLYTTKGDLCRIKQDLNTALVYYYKALKLYEANKDTSEQVNIHYDIGQSDYELNNFIPANRHFYSSIYFAQLLGDKKRCLNSHGMIGTIFKDGKKFDSALFHHNIELDLSIQLKDDAAIANSYNNLGLTYKRNNQHEKALEYLIKALEMREKLNDKRGIAGTNINIGNTLKRLERYKDAVPYFDRGVEIAKNSGNFDFYLNGLVGRARNFNALGDYKRAATELSKYVEMKDSLTKLMQNKQLAEMEVNYQTEKKDIDLKLQMEQIKAKTSENSRQKTVIVASIIALSLSLIAIFFIYRSFKLNKENAIQLVYKNTVIEQKSKEITDSINYAKLIQQSLLASKEMLDKNLGNYFILYKPKDIVSGDFYWGCETSNGFLIACIDCTGHGVPGAFMSLIGKENLDKAVAKTSNPKEILSELNIGVKKSLSQNSKNGGKDGMDAAILKIKKENKSSLITYSGANRPLWIIRKSANSTEMIEATKQAIAGYTRDDQVFEEHQITVNEGDMLYIFTDGFADQFGSDKNKKMTTKRFRDLLNSVHTLEPEKQKQELENFFTNWKKESEQLDDLLVIGISI